MTGLSRTNGWSGKPQYSSSNQSDSYFFAPNHSYTKKSAPPISNANVTRLIDTCKVDGSNVSANTLIQNYTFELLEALNLPTTRAYLLDIEQNKKIAVYDKVTREPIPIPNTSRVQRICETILEIGGAKKPEDPQPRIARSAQENQQPQKKVVSCVSNNSPSVAPIPAGLIDRLPHPKTPWLISQGLFKSIQKQSADSLKHFVACPVLNSDPEYAFVMHYFFHQKPPGFGVKNIMCIHNPDQTKMFEGSLKSMELAAQKFPPAWKDEEPKAERASTMKRWDASTKQFSPVQLVSSKRTDIVVSARVVPLWNGTKHAESICTSGFTFFGKHHLLDPSAKAGANASTDIGFFGSGIYFTNSPAYAAMYNPGNLLLTLVAMREPYPVVSDVLIPKKGTDMLKLQGKGAYQSYNAHYIPVTSIEPKDPECMAYHPCHKTEIPAWDEYVVFEKAQALPRFWVELGVDFPAQVAAPPATVDMFLNKLLELLENPQVKQDQEIAHLLSIKCDTLIDLDPSSSLSAENQKFYLWTLKLFDQAGKLRNAVKQRLTQPSGSFPSLKLEEKKAQPSTSKVNSSVPMQSVQVQPNTNNGKTETSGP